jgi:hypothetical protein
MYHGSHNHGVLCLGRHSHHEGFIDFDAVDRQLVEMGQRRITGAKIINGKLEAHLLHRS